MRLDKNKVEHRQTQCGICVEFVCNFVVNILGNFLETTWKVINNSTPLHLVLFMDTCAQSI